MLVTRPKVWNLLCVTAVLVNAALETIVVPALPQIREMLALTAAQSAWLFSVLLIAAAVSLPIAGRLADIFGPRAVIVATLGCVTAGVAISAVAADFATMLLGQAMQGPMLSLVPLSLALLKEADAEGTEGSVSSSGIIAAASASTLLGMALAALFLERYSYRALFWAAFAVNLGMLACSIWLISRSAVATRRTGDKVDVVGALLLGGGLIGALLGVSLMEIRMMYAMGAFIAGALLIAGALKWFASTRAPLLDLRLLVTPEFGQVALVQFACGFGTFGMFVLLPMILSSPSNEGGLGLSATSVSTCLLPFGLTGAISPLVIPAFRRVLAVRAILISGCLFLLMAPLAALLATNPWELAGSAALLGAGVGIVVTQSLDLLADRMPLDRLATFSALAYVLRIIGCAFGGLIAAVVASSTHAAGFQVALYVVAAAMLAPFLTTLALPTVTEPR